MRRLQFCLIFLFSFTGVFAQEQFTQKNNSKSDDISSIHSSCMKGLKSFPKKFDEERIRSLCTQVQVLDGCYSQTNKSPIFHFEKVSQLNRPLKILTFALIHGNEPEGGTLARKWMDRLQSINPRSTWRIVPLLNPDGHQANTRTNSRGVDLNRNFPTDKFNPRAIDFWKKSYKGHESKYPGPAGASEQETKCAISHIEDFVPDFIISLHTPFGILDFDGPTFKFPRFEKMPWRRLGNYPGSLGRYMWRERKVPVLTIELKGDEVIQSFSQIDTLQDISGLVALMSQQILEKKSEKNSDSKKSKTN
ncbi:MAG: succinylglutamate desuccinylase/aspartoacylase family protein [Halobacteriovoraceae bacterium]|nr:succinylglutamate desuccinylase/aspartoacylase family protein [Halobacteriovoraceae bacterium]